MEMGRKGEEKLVWHDKKNNYFSKLHQEPPRKTSKTRCINTGYEIIRENS